MGFYVETPMNKGKAGYIVNMHGGIKIAQPRSFNDVPAGKALICVIDNGMFEAAGYLYDAAEFRDFTSPSDTRPKTFVLLDKEKANALTGYVEPNAQAASR